MLLRIVAGKSSGRISKKLTLGIVGPALVTLTYRGTAAEFGIVNAATT